MLRRFLFAVCFSLTSITLRAQVVQEVIPRSASAGARVILVGSALNQNGIRVKFPAADGRTIPANVISQSASLLEFEVPQGAVSGNVSIALNNAVVTQLPFTVTSSPAWTRVATLSSSALKEPSGVAVVLPSGVVAVADRGNHQIKLVAPDGTNSVLAGSGTPGFVDGAQAQFKAPAAIAFDAATQSLFVADSGNNAVRRVTLNGVVSTVAGSGRPGDADGIGAGATFNQPSGITIGTGGNLFVADTGNDQIRRVEPDGTVAIFAGGLHPGFADGPAAQALFKNPQGIASTPAGTLYIADTGNHAVRKIDNGVVLTVAGTGHDGFLDGPATIAEFKQPSGVAVDQAGNVVVADTMNDTLRMITASSPNPVVTTIAGARKEGFVNGDPTSAQFKQPNDVLVEGAAFIADTKNDAIRILYSALSATALYPRTADPNGGTVVRLFGAGFVPGAMRVVFGGVASSVTYVTSTELLVTAPPHPIGSVDVVVSSPNGVATLQNTFRYVPPFTAVRVTPASPTITSGQGQQFTAVAVAADNSTIDVTSRATWSSSDPTVATIDANGLATSLKAGTTSISATFANLTQTVLLTVVALETPPPDPSTLATPIDGTVVSSISDTVQFLYTGPNPIQRGVTPGTIQAARVAVIRGQIHSADGAPLPSVRVTILGHPELGHTLSRVDGWYDLAVNGGGDVTIVYDKSGYLSAQRRTRTPWRDFVVLGDIYMTAFDPAATTVNMAAPTMQVARASVVTDSDGSRRATVLVPTGTTATIETPNGSQVATTLTIRATEFTVGSNGQKMMPAALPPASAYTYCVELSADEATAASANAVRFSKPVAFYIENFLGFPVGTAVPVGYYDRDRSAWIAQANGIALRVVTVADGRATVDLNGDGVADDPSSIGISTDELQQLASLYQPDQSLWRITTDHFTAVDLNFPATIDPPGVATPPRTEPPQHSPSVDSPTTTCGSTIDCHNQVYGESIPIVGTPFSLEYQSDEVPGHLAGRVVDIPISGTTVPTPLKRIDVDVLIAGRLFHFSRPPVPNQSIRFTWDGLDAYGRQVQGSQVAHIQIRYVYDAFVYSPPAPGNLSFGLPSSSAAPLRRTRQEVSLDQESDTLLGGVAALPLGFGGWRIDANDVLNVNGGVLTRGPAETSTTSLQRPVITRFAGGGSSTASAGIATDMRLGIPWAMAPAPDGSVYISENTFIGVIRRVAPGGLMNTAINAGSVTAMVVGPDELLYFTNAGHLRRGDPFTGSITELTAPSGCCKALAFGPEGSLYIATQGGIVRRNPDGTNVALTGDSSLPRNISPAGLPALATNIGQVNGIAVGRDGRVYFSLPTTFFNGTNLGGRVFRISPTGIIERFAGTEAYTTGFTGDGGPAVQAELSYPDALAAAPDGSLYLSDSNTYTIRRVLPNGVITTVAGNPGFNTYALDGTPAPASYVNFPKNMAVGTDGAVYISDDFAMTVRRIAPPDLSATGGRTLVVPSTDGRSASVFAPNGRHQRTVDAITNVALSSFGYDATGRLVSIADRYGNTTTFERDSSGNATAITSPFGDRTVLAINAGYLASVTNPAGEQFQMTYTADGLLTGFRNPRGIPKTIAYDTLGRFIREDRADGGSLAITGPPTIGGSFQVAVRSAEGQTTAHDIQRSSTGNDVRTDTDVTTQLKTKTTRTTDGGQSIALPDGSVVLRAIQGDPRFQSLAPLTTTTASTPAGHRLTSKISRSVTLADRSDPLSVTSLVETLSVNSRQWQTAFTSSNRSLVTRTPLGRQSTVVLNGQSDVASIQIPGLATATFAYNTKGQLASIQQSARHTDFGYNSSGLIERITDPLSRSVSFLYDKAGRVTQQTLPDGRLITFTYDASGNLTSVTPPSRPAHAFAWNVRDDQQQYSPPPLNGTGATQYTYNRDRQLTTVLRPDGQSVALLYDAAGRLKTLTTPADTYSYSYSAQTGALSAASAPAGDSVNYQFDGPLPTNVEWKGPVSGSIAYAYDNDFRVVSEGGIPFGYDADGLLTSAGALQLRRDPANGLLTGTTLGGISDSYTYNEFGEVTGYSATLSGATLFAEDYMRDAGGRIQQRTETLNGGSLVDSFGYDTAGRLTSVASGVNVTQYAYDANSNRTSKTSGSPSESATYDSQDRLLTYGSAAYAYAANGELSTRTDSSGITRYGYDALGNLRTVILPDGRSIEYVIDGQNRRVGKKVNGALVRGWLFGDQLRIVAELDGNSAVVSRFIYGSHTNVPDYMVRNGVTYRFLTNQVGSPRMVIDASTGAIAQMIGYDEFGAVLADTAPGFQPFGFAGGLYDPDSKLVRFGARDYDPQVGRWTAKDPIMFGGGDTSLYAYVTDDPINFADETGLAVLIGRHSAFFPGDPENHAAIVLRPDDPSQFSGQPWFTRTGGQEATLGGQAWGTGSNHTWWPTPFGRLHGVANFPGDNPRNLSNLTPVSCPTGMNDTQFITSLINAASRYDNNAPYDPLPSRLGPYYNSNSYAAGVIRAAGGIPPPLANVPGYNKPLPIH
jgi:RHS repeat-associated protein